MNGTHRSSDAAWDAGDERGWAKARKAEYDALEASIAAREAEEGTPEERFCSKCGDYYDVLIKDGVVKDDHVCSNYFAH